MQQIAGGAGIQQQQQRPGKVQLGEFWPQAPNAWFAAVELKFEVANINSEREHFAYSVGAMGYNVLFAVMDLVENPPVENPYTMLKGRLVLAHQLTLVQKATRCLHLAGTALTNLKELAQMADRLWLCHGPQPIAAVFREEYQSEDDSSDIVAALPTRRRPQQKQGGQQVASGQQGQVPLL